jgi:hypothetical protein
VSRATTLQRSATAAHCGRRHDLTIHGRLDKKSGRIICRECQKERLAERGQVAASFTMSAELLCRLDIEADSLGLSRNVLLAVAVIRFLEDA